MAAALIAGAVAASVLILPVKAWLNQREELSNREAVLNALQRENTELAADVARLQTQSGIIEAAREELGQVHQDEKVYRVQEEPALTGQLPEGWLYPTIGRLLAARVGQPALAPDLTASADSVP